MFIVIFLNEVFVDFIEHEKQLFMSEKWDHLLKRVGAYIILLQ